MRPPPFVVACIVAFLGASGCETPPAPPPTPVPANLELGAHSAEFKQEIVEVTDGVHVAIGYGLANSILLEGSDGVVIIDTMESAEAAGPVKVAFDAINPKPVKAIIYTHNHADHVFGARVFAGDDEPEVWAHATTADHLDRILNVIRPIIFRRSMRQFGNYLPADQFINCGIGPRLLNDATTTPALLRPTHTFDGERTSIRVAGLDIELVHAPGETADQIFVWLPANKVLLPGDNYYKSFPNLYAIRGTAHRDVMDWVTSLDEMRALEPEFLVPSHTRPVSGAEEIRTVLTDYRDAIQYVHDQTVRLMNLDLGPDEIVARVKLPWHLASKAYLREYYGRVDWSVRAIFDGYLGWFGGDATDLAPLDTRARAERMAKLAGGADALLQHARAAMSDEDYAWALDLTSAILGLDLERGRDEAGAIRAEALRKLGASQLSANARNYYLTQALEAEGAITITPPEPSTAPADLLASFPVGNFLRAMSVNLDAEKSEDIDTIVGFRFPDVDEEYTLHVRRGVAEVQPRFPVAPDITVTTDSTVWKEILANKRNAAAAIATGDVDVEGGRIALARFLLLFR